MGPAFAAVLLVLGAPQPPDGERALPLSDGRWELRGAARVERDGEREVLSVETGAAVRGDVSLQDGTIDFEVQLTRRRSFVYLLFRVAAEGEHEEVYLRPHKSGLPDALQYAPVWQGQSAWQLHHGPGATAPVELDAGVWTRVRLVISGSRAALYVGDLGKPALVIPRLAREPRAGSIALRGFKPPDGAAKGPIARFANVVVRPGAASVDLPSEAAAAKPPAADAGIVRAWAVSRSFLPKESVSAELPTGPVLGELQRVETGADGLLELHRFVKMPEGSRRAAAVARVRVRAAKAGVYPFDLGFSDVATVFVNGQPIFRCDASYSFDAPRREGLIGYDQARLYLSLAAGDNDLAILLSDGFGGWGLMGRFPSPEGLQVEAR
jgi:hypothetical protein